MSDTRPIGVFDSGIGGLTVVREIFRIMPGERVIYLGDTARYPYGHRTDDTIQAFAVEGIRAFLKYDIKLIVIACNTVSAVALEMIEKEAGEVPVIGVVLPGARAAVMRTADRKIGVIGTYATVRSDIYRKVIHQIDASIKVYENPGPLLIPLVEEKLIDHDITRLTAQFYLYEMIDLGVDCLILGSSYYPPLMEVIQGTVGTRMQLLDSALWTGKEVQDILTALDIRSEQTGDGEKNSTFLFTEILHDHADHAALFYGGELPCMDVITIS